MTDIMLRGALAALKTKIEAIAKEPGVTAEDLAMLGTALERIAGKTTAVEIEMLGDEQKVAIKTLTTAERNAALDAMAQKRAEIRAAVDALSDRIASEISAADLSVNALSGRIAGQIAAADAAVSAIAAETQANLAASVRHPSAETFFFSQL